MRRADVGKDVSIVQNFQLLVSSIFCFQQIDRSSPNGGWAPGSTSLWANTDPKAMGWRSGDESASAGMGALPHHPGARSSSAKDNIGRPL